MNTRKLLQRDEDSHSLQEWAAAKYASAKLWMTSDWSGYAVLIPDIFALLTRSARGLRAGPYSGRCAYEWWSCGSRPTACPLAFTHAHHTLWRLSVTAARCTYNSALGWIIDTCTTRTLSSVGSSTSPLPRCMTPLRRLPQHRFHGIPRREPSSFSTCRSRPHLQLKMPHIRSNFTHTRRVLCRR